jgi:hypothetical protein
VANILVRLVGQTFLSVVAGVSAGIVVGRTFLSVVACLSAGIVVGRTFLSVVAGVSAGIPAGRTHAREPWINSPGSGGKNATARRATTDENVCPTEACA